MDIRTHELIDAELCGPFLPAARIVRHALQLATQRRQQRIIRPGQRQRR